MKCPHCLVEIHSSFSKTTIRDCGDELSALNAQGEEASWTANSMICPACKKAIIFLQEYVTGAHRSPSISLILPRSACRPKAPPQVPANLADDFNESCAVITDSPKASAALSRRCLQGLLRLNGYTQKDLAQAIDAIFCAKQLPSSLATSLDAVRNIGNFAAHPMKDSNSGEILPVEPNEAEWNLDVLEGLFDFFYVLPAKELAKISALNAKLASAGKPPIKQTA